MSEEQKRDREGPTRSANDDWKPRPVYVPKTWAVALSGSGRWVTLQSPLGTEACLLYTNDDDVLWYIQIGEHPEAIALAQSLVSSLMGAKYADAKASRVFDYWADRTGPTVFSGPSQQGNLRLIAGA